VLEPTSRSTDTIESMFSIGSDGHAKRQMLARHKDDRALDRSRHPQG
jgi:hypothetical protein